MPVVRRSSSVLRRPLVRRRCAKVWIDPRTSSDRRRHSKRGSPKSAQALPTVEPAATRVDSDTWTSSAGSLVGGSGIVTVCQRRSVHWVPGSIETVCSVRQFMAGTRTSNVKFTRGGRSCHTCGESAQSQENEAPAGTLAWYSSPAGGWHSMASSTRCRRLTGPIQRIATDSSGPSDHRRDGADSRRGNVRRTR